MEDKTRGRSWSSIHALKLRRFLALDQDVALLRSGTPSSRRVGTSAMSPSPLHRPFGDSPLKHLFLFVFNTKLMSSSMLNPTFRRSATGPTVMSMFSAGVSGHYRLPDGSSTQPQLVNAFVMSTDGNIFAALQSAIG